MTMGCSGSGLSAKRPGPKKWSKKRNLKSTKSLDLMTTLCQMMTSQTHAWHAASFPMMKFLSLSSIIIPWRIAILYGISKKEELEEFRLKLLLNKISTMCQSLKSWTATLRISLSGAFITMRKMRSTNSIDRVIRSQLSLKTLRITGSSVSQSWISDKWCSSETRPWSREAPQKFCSSSRRGT